MNSELRKKKIVRASWVGIVGNGILAVAKIWVGTIAGSVALVGAGIDTATDIVTSVVTLFTANIASKPPDKEHPYGHGRAEAIAAKLLSFIIITAGFQLLVKAGSDIFRGRATGIPGTIAIYISIVTIAVKFFLFLFKLKIGRDVNSQMVIADAMNMKADILLSVSVLVGLFFTIFLDIPIIDTIMATVIGFWVIKNGISVFMDSNDELMEGAGDASLYELVFATLKGVEGVSHPHRVRIRKINTMYIIDLDIEVDGDLTVREGHDLAVSTEKKLKESINNLYDVIVHVEPKGIYEEKECYGLEENSFCE